ncbi:MAG: PD-(D/E)XK nuclease family protein [Opitutales bacterium]|nr:PD-(D/E)XK nuclease family protein [Opitutales bacterium]
MENEKDIEDIFDKIKEILGEKQKTDEKLKFNIFSAISDVFYRENFHSDILCMLLKREEIFASLIKYLFGDLYFEKINGDHVVSKEYSTNDGENDGRIDIFIQYKVEKKGHCIILENKINKAVDQYRQLYRYYDHCRKNNTVDKIIYLTFDKNEEPNFGNGYKGDETEKIKQLLWSVDAENFCEKILNPKNVKDENISSALIQYKNLINYIKGSSIMCANKEIYELVKEGKNRYKILKDFCEVFNNFTSYVAKDVFEEMREKNVVKILKNSLPNSVCNKNFIFFDSAKIEDNREEYKNINYGFRLEFCFELDSFSIQFRYYGYRGIDDAALKEIVDEKDILNKIENIFNENIFNEKITRTPSEKDKTSIKYIYSIDELDNIEEIKKFLTSGDMKNLYIELDNSILGYLDKRKNENTEQ